MVNVMIGEIFELAGAVIESTINIGEIIGAVVDIGDNINKNKTVQDEADCETASPSFATSLSNITYAGQVLQKEASKTNENMDKNRPSQQSNLTYDEKIDRIIEQVNRFKSNQNSYAYLQRYTTLINKMLEIKANYVAQFNTQHDLHVMEQTIDAIYDDIFQYEV